MPMIIWKATASDLMYGGLGQDDIVGGSSALFGLITERCGPTRRFHLRRGRHRYFPQQHRDATEDSDTHLITTTATGHVRDADTSWATTRTCTGWWT